MANDEFPPYQQRNMPYQMPLRPAEPPPIYSGYDAAQFGQYGPGYPTGGGMSGLAIASLVCSLLSLGLVGVILGHLALGEIKRSNGLKEGRGLAIAGLIIGYLEIALGVAVVLIFIISALLLRATPPQ